MATRKRSASAEAWALVNDHVETEAGIMCQWANSDTGQSVLLAEGITPIDNPNALIAPAIVNAMPEEPIEETAADRIAAMLGKASGFERAKVKVQRVRENGDLVFCNNYTAEDFERGNTLELIRKHFGEGRYYIELYAKNPKSGLTSRYAKDTVEIAALPVVDEPKTPAADDIRAIIRAELGQRGDPVSQLKETLGLMVMMREAMGINAQANPIPQKSVADQLAELFGAMKIAREMAGEMNAPPEPKDPLMELANQALPIIAQAMNKTAPGPQQLQPVQLPASMASPTLPPPAPTETEQDVPQADPSVEEMRKAIGSVNFFARIDADPEGTASVIYEKLPDEAIPILRSDEWWDTLRQIEPAVTNYKPWYDKVRAILLGYIAEDDADSNNQMLPAA